MPPPLTSALAPSTPVDAGPTAGRVQPHTPRQRDARVKAGPALAAGPRAVAATARSSPTADGIVPAEAKRWFALAVGSLVIAGLLSLSVVLGRLPLLSRIIDDPLFFKRCLVVHVDLALVVWFYAFLAGLMALRTPRGEGTVGRLAFVLSVGGVVAMLAGGLVRGAQPVLANYVPVIDHPLFGAGLTAFFAGAFVFFVQSLTRPTEQSPGELPADAAIGLQAAALTTVIAAATWVSARAGLPAGTDTYTRAEFLAWGPGHVLQAANAAAMLAVWLWLIQRATGAPLFSERGARRVFALLVGPQFAMPLLTMRGTLDSLYHTGATQLMRWTLFPAVLLVVVHSVRHLWRLRSTAGGRQRDPVAPVARAGFAASVGLAVLGMVLGACIRSSTTLVPAHYHASLGAVTMAFMTAAFLVCDAARRSVSAASRSPARERRDPAAPAAGYVGSCYLAAEGPGHKSRPYIWRHARWQLLAYGVGQAVFVAGFAIGGAYGLGRKAYAAEQHVRSAGELAGLVVMGVGGLVAVAGGLWFLFLVLREMRSWRASRAVAAAEPLPSST